MPDITIPSTPDPQMTTLVYTGIRAVLTVLGALGVTWGAGVSQTAWQIVAGGIVMLGSVIWSFVDKYRTARRDHAGSVASAASGAAVKVV